MIQDSQDQDFHLKELGKEVDSDESVKYDDAEVQVDTDELE
jgi:hypothetical protein